LRLSRATESVALRHRNIVAADAVAVAKLIDANQIGNRRLRADCIASE
jgi:hypothetical protein